MVVNIKIVVLWDLTLNNLVDRYVLLEYAATSRVKEVLPPWRWLQQVPPKCIFLCIKLHGVISQHTVILIFPLFVLVLH